MWMLQLLWSSLMESCLWSNMCKYLIQLARLHCEGNPTYRTFWTLTLLLPVGTLFNSWTMGWHIWQLVLGASPWPASNVLCSIVVGRWYTSPSPSRFGLCSLTLTTRNAYSWKKKLLASEAWSSFWVWIQARHKLPIHLWPHVLGWCSSLMVHLLY